MRREGRVTWFNEAKGYGFITTDDGMDLYVNYSEVQRDGFRTLEQGEEVTFLIEDADKAPKAVEVRIKGEGGLGSLI